ncbi:MAG: YbfB/YjiJ family MFS transporter [Burkholderiaceae bacterium]|nr:YbfB/YjiJ family MFS transporter [Burkholderiaceae bacterium]
MARASAGTTEQALAAAFAGLCALALGMGIGRFAYTPVLPAMQSEFGLSVESAGLIASANFAGYLAGALLAIRVAHGARHRAYVCAVLASVATTLLMAALSNAGPIAAVRFLSGLASAFLLVHGSSIVLDRLAAARRLELAGVHYAGVGVGIAASALIVDAALRLGATSTWQWIALGTASLLLAVPALAMADPACEAPRSAAHALEHARARRATRANGRHARAFVWLTCAYGGLGFGYVITVTFIVVMVRGNPQWRAWEMMIWLAVGLAAAPSNYLWQWAARRIDPWRAMAVAFALEACGVLAAASANSLVLVFAGAILLGGTFVGITALGLTTARELSSGTSGTAIATMTAAFGAGQIIGPAVGAWLAERSGGFWAPSLAAASVLMISAAMVTIGRPGDAALIEGS